ncbi:chitin synthase [Paramecium bursaria Chlorella virus NE-JV-1]|nr:chitin synthase [Paramecium bursaria Chlorella virus NE-JV-1]
MDSTTNAIVLSTSAFAFVWLSLILWWVCRRGSPLKIQSAVFLAYLTIVNGGLIALAIVYSEYWWAFIPILGMPAMSLIYYTFVRFFYFVFRLGYYGQKKIEYSNADGENPFVYVLTAYRETGEELERTMKSLYAQTGIKGKKYIILIADGDFESAAALRKMFPGFKRIIANAYKDWNGDSMDLEMITYQKDDWNALVLIKSRNAGKRDSLVLVRTLAFNTLRGTDAFALDDMNPDVMDIYQSTMPKAKYIVGTDADTMFVPGCTKALLDDMQAPGKRPVDGTVGYIVPQAISETSFVQKLWVIYQFVEYTNAQVIRRAAQSRIYEKVSCLSGACQALYVDTMCETALLRVFNTPPPSKPSLMASIMSFASEDRRACVLSLSHDKPRFRQVMSRDSIALTEPPLSLKVFISQRRRWSLGAAMNDWYLFLYGSKMNVFERFFALVNVFSWALVPLYFATIGIVLYAVIVNFDMLMLYVGTVMLYNYFVVFTIPFWAPTLTMRERLTYIPKYIVFFLGIPWIALMVHYNGIAKSWMCSWGKTIVKSADVAKEQV